MEVSDALESVGEAVDEKLEEAQETATPEHVEEVIADTNEHQEHEQHEDSLADVQAGIARIDAQNEANQWLMHQEQHLRQEAKIDRILDRLEASTSQSEAEPEPIAENLEVAVMPPIEEAQEATQEEAQEATQEAISGTSPTHRRPLWRKRR